MFGIINFDELSGNMISGLEEQEINEISDIQQILRSDPTILDEDITETFPIDSHVLNTKIIPNDRKQKIQKIENAAIPTSIAKQQECWTSKFNEFLKERNINKDLTTVTKIELNDMLRYFYSELRTKKGRYYSKASLICIRAALFRFFKSERSFNIINDVHFFMQIKY